MENQSQTQCSDLQPYAKKPSDLLENMIPSSIRVFGTFSYEGFEQLGLATEFMKDPFCPDTGSFQKLAELISQTSVGGEPLGRAKWKPD